ncbi:MAG: tRNA wybutosine-synthesizing 3 family protein [Candidatus Woesearchaeota archaeon]
MFQKPLPRKDRSRKGEIDKEILTLVDQLNKHPNYYTTSSCAGRIVVLEKQRRKCDNRFIFSSHSKAKAEEVVECLSKIGKNPVWFKQESVILHVCCKDLESADRLLDCARKAGLKHSGIISVKTRIIAELVGTEAMETLFATNGKVIAAKEYVKLLVEEANRKLATNKKRIELLERILAEELL